MSGDASGIGIARATRNVKFSFTYSFAARTAFDCRRHRALRVRGHCGECCVIVFIRRNRDRWGIAFARRHYACPHRRCGCHRANLCSAYAAHCGGNAHVLAARVTATRNATAACANRCACRAGNRRITTGLSARVEFGTRRNRHRPHCAGPTGRARRRESARARRAAAR